MKLSFSHNSHGTKHRLALPKHSFLHKIGRDSTVDWLVMLACGVFLIALFAGVGYIKYVSSERIIHLETEVAVPQKIVEFQESRLKNALSKYDDRKNARSAMQSGQLTIPDPGI